MRIDSELIDAAACDAGGVPLGGRRAELSALRRAGYADLSVGRIYEGHVNALQLIARFGTAPQRETARADVRDGRLFGVWNTQDDEPVRIVAEGPRFRLSGAKSWASGAAFVARPVVTAAWPDGSLQMCVVPMDAVAPAIDPSAWRPHGMHDSQSYRVAFDGIALDADRLIGAPGDYLRQPYFFGGALRFTAVQTGGIERLVVETARYLAERGRDGDLVQTMRLGEMHVALRTALYWLDAGADAWTAYDASVRDVTAIGQAAHERLAADVVDAADGARIAIERAALDVIERTMRAVGARGLLEPLPFVRLVRDLEMYLRQPAPDAAVARAGRAAFDAASAQRSVASATGNGSSAVRANVSEARASNR
ncbi:MAG: acyl-CoA dehydrogenase family protein [Vulcanimicrobiaceae bacterium]